MTTENPFAALLGELEIESGATETMAKALAGDDGKGDKEIAAAAAEGAEGEAPAEGAAEGEAEGAEPKMAKSFTLMLDDGTEMEAVDGAELVKSLVDRVEANETSMVKALTVAVDLIKGQGALIKSMGDKLEALGKSGVGRKAVLTVAERAPAPTETPLAKSEPEGVTEEAFFAKALSAQAAGRIAGIDVARAEAARNKGLPVPADILSRVFAE